MRTNRKPKYFGFYHGPSYGGWESEFAMGFSSLADAKHAFNAFWLGGATTDEYRMTNFGFHVPWDMATYSATPATSREDYMDLYSVTDTEWLGMYKMSDDIDYRLTWGTRGGIVVEK